MLQHSLFDVGSAILSEAGAPNVLTTRDRDIDNQEQGKQHILNNNIELHESAGTINCFECCNNHDYYNLYMAILWVKLNFSTFEF